MNNYKSQLHADSQRELSSLIDGAGLSTETQKEAQNYITEAIENENISLIGRGISAIVPAAVLLASRETGEVRTAKEISQHTTDDITKERIHHTTKYLREGLNLGIVMSDPEDFIDRIGSELDASKEEINLTKKIVSILDEEEILVNKAANSIAAATFYFGSIYGEQTEPYSQDEIGEAVDISSQTIRTNYKEIKNEMPECKLESLPIRIPQKN